MAEHDEISGDWMPVLPRHVRMQRDRVSDAFVLLYPEGALELDASGRAVLERCDGTRSLQQIVGELAAHFEANEDMVAADVRKFLTALGARKLIEWKS